MGPASFGLALLPLEEGQVAWDLFAPHVLDDVEAGGQVAVLSSCPPQVDADEAAVPEEPLVVLGQHPLQESHVLDRDPV